MITLLNYGPQIRQRQQHAGYIESIEEDFEKTWRFVEPHKKNFSAFSVEYSRLILDAGSMVDVLARHYCTQRFPHVAEPRDLWHALKLMTTLAGNLHKIECECRRIGLSTKPFSTFRGKKPTLPAWWKVYNNVKHHRTQHFAAANFRNTFEAVAGCVFMFQMCSTGFGHPSRLFQVADYSVLRAQQKKATAKKPGP